MRMIKSKCGNHIADDKILTGENTLRVKRITLKRSDDSLTSDVTEMLNFNVMLIEYKLLPRIVRRYSR